MKRFFVAKIQNPPVLAGENHKHLSVVLRAKAGEEVVLCCGDGYDNICRIEQIRKNETVLSFVRKEKNESEPTVKLSLFMSVMKGDKNDLVVQKATELGVTDIYPVITQYVQGHDRTLKTERLNRIALEAAKQCGRSVLTVVHETQDFSAVLELLKDFDVVVFPYEKAVAPSLKEFLRAAFTDSKQIKSVAVFIGSEGGFSDGEANALKESGVVPVTLGKRILRAETANIAVISAVMYEWEQWK